MTKQLINESQNHKQGLLTLKQEFLPPLDSARGH